MLIIDHSGSNLDSIEMFLFCSVLCVALVITHNDLTLKNVLRSFSYSSVSVKIDVFVS